MARIALAVFSSLIVTTSSSALPPLQQRAGEAIAGLTPNERALFEIGKVEYSTPFSARTPSVFFQKHFDQPDDSRAPSDHYKRETCR